jgi:hypothetical protein
MEKFMLVVFGPSWRTTLLGYAGAALVEGALALEALPGNPVLWHLAAVLVAAFGRAMKDSAVTGGSVPATREAVGRVKAGIDGIVPLLVLITLLGAFPVFAEEVDPTAGTVDGATVADQTAQAAPDFRFGLTLPLPGSPVLVPAVAITPFAVSLRDGSVTTGFTVGAGYELLWRATTPTARGVAGYLNMRQTADGARPLVSVLGIFTPYLGAGIGYQVGGGVSSFRDAAVLLVSVGTNLGAPPAASSQ